MQDKSSDQKPLFSFNSGKMYFFQNSKLTVNALIIRCAAEDAFMDLWFVIKTSSW